MRIEEALQTQNFKSEHHKAMLNIMFTASWLRGHFVQIMKKYGLSQEQFNVLRILRGAKDKPLCLKDITDRMIDRNSNTTRILDKLVNKGFVKKWRCDIDRREVKIAITEQGLGLLAEIDEEENIDRPKYLNLSDTEANLLNALLDKLRDHQESAQ